MADAAVRVSRAQADLGARNREIGLLTKMLSKEEQACTDLTAELKVRLSPAADVGGAGPSPRAEVGGWAQSWRRFARGEPSPGADVASVSPVPVQMWHQ
jgi:hypothetical protein